MTEYLFASDPHGRGNPWIKHQVWTRYGFGKNIGMEPQF